MINTLCWNAGNCDRSKCCFQHVDDEPQYIQRSSRGRGRGTFSPKIDKPSSSKIGTRRSSKDQSLVTGKKAENDDLLTDQSALETFYCNICETFFNSQDDLQRHHVELNCSDLPPSQSQIPKRTRKMTEKMSKHMNSTKKLPALQSQFFVPVVESNLDDVFDDKTTSEIVISVDSRRKRWYNVDVTEGLGSVETAGETEELIVVDPATETEK